MSVAPASLRQTNSTNGRSHSRARPTSARSAPPAVRWSLQALDRVAPHTAERVVDRLLTSPFRHPRPLWEAEALAGSWPAMVRSGGVRVATWEWLGRSVRPLGKLQDDLPTVILVHGWEGRGSQLGRLVPPLLARGVRVVTFDAPGHGDSGGRRSTVTRSVNALRDVVDAVGGVDAVVAHSFGAIVTALALRQGLSASRVALVGPGIWTEDTPKLFETASGASAPLLSRVMAKQAARTGLRWSDLVAEQVYAGRHEPLFVAHDADDREVPIDRLPRLTATWQPEQVVRTQGLGHRRILRDPAVTEAVAAWVTAG